MELLLIRHGRPERIDYDPNGANPGLTDLGHRQANAMTHYLAGEHLDAIYVSPQQRAIDTSIPLASHNELDTTIVEGIAEFDYGYPSYIPGEESGPLTGDELAKLIADVTSDAFTGRVLDSIGDIISNHSGQKVAAVCHGGVISTVLTDLLDVTPGTYFDSHYTSVTRIKASSAGRRSMASFNECPWLREL